MGNRKRDVEALARDIERGLAKGMDLFDALSSSPVGQELEIRLKRDPSAKRQRIVEREMAKAHRQAVIANERLVAERTRRIAKLKARTNTHGMASVILVGAASGDLLLELIGGGLLPGPPLLWLIGSGGLALSARRAKRAAARAEAAVPPAPVLPPPPPARLRAGAIGYKESEQLAFAEHRLFEIIPAVGRLHPEAGAELGEAASAVAPLLRDQVERLAVLDRLALDMPGSQAAEAAARGSAEITRRLAEGVDTIDRLLGAAATMLAAPDLGRGVAEILSPAIDALTAYAHGLAAADTSSPNFGNF